MGVAASSTVQEVEPSSYSHSRVVDKKEHGDKFSFRLYAVTSKRFEAVLYNPEHNAKAFSVFKLEDEQLAKEKFR